jgi:hypothetical protein
MFFLFRCLTTAYCRKRYYWVLWQYILGCWSKGITYSITLHYTYITLYIYKVFQKELYKFESLYKFIQRTCTVWVSEWVNLRPTVSRPVCPGVRRPSGTCDQFFFLLEISFRHLRIYKFVAPSLTRGRVCNVAKHNKLYLGELRFSKCFIGYRTMRDLRTP